MSIPAGSRAGRQAGPGTRRPAAMSGLREFAKSLGSNAPSVRTAGFDLPRMRSFAGICQAEMIEDVIS